MIGKLAVLVLASCVSWSVHAADDLESLDEDFLSYLAEFEGDEDDWTIVEQTPATVPVAAKPAAPEQKTSKTPSNTPPKQPPVKPATPDDGSKR